MKAGKAALVPVSVILCLGLVAVIAGIVDRQLRQMFETKVSNSFTLFIREMKETKQLVLLKTTNQFTYRKELSKKLLFLDTNATVEVSVIAEIHYFVDLGKQESIAMRVNPMGRECSLRLPPPEVLYPSLHTETIRVQVLDRDILSGIALKIRKRVEEMKSDISDEVYTQAKLSLGSPEIREKMGKSLSDLVLGYMAKGRIGIKKVNVEFI
jgi:hypothetical protein